MKRSLPCDDRKMKKVKSEEGINDDVVSKETQLSRGLGYFDDNLLFEVLKHVDAKTLAMAGCVNKQWHKTAQDERLWELICTKQWVNTGCGEQQLRSVVLALGGFRRLHSLYILPLSKPQTTSSSSSSSSAWGPISSQVIKSKPLPRLGKDERVKKIDEELDLKKKRIGLYTEEGKGLRMPKQGRRESLAVKRVSIPKEHKETDAKVLLL